MEQGNTDLVLLLWATRAFAVVMLLGVVAIVAGGWWVIARPVFVEALRARRTGDWWHAFLPRDGGSWGPLAQNRWWSVFRADRRGTTGGLAWRWAWWGAVAAVFTVVLPYAVMSSVVRLAGVLTNG